jgi:predicted Zn-dependent protease
MMRLARRSRDGAWPMLVVVGALVSGTAACGIDTEEDFGQGGRETGVRETVPVAVTQPRLVRDTQPIAPVEPPIPENVSYEDAEQVFRSGEYVQAVRMFEAYTVRRPENPWGHYMLGLSAWRVSDHERATAALERTVEIAPSHVKGLLNLARVLHEDGKPSEAVAYLERVVDLNPELGEGWRVLGNVRAALGQPDGAIEAYRRALLLDGSDAWAMNNLGLLMIRLGRFDEALAPLARATELRPEMAVFQNNLGVVLERCGDLEGAVHAYRSAVAGSPAHERARVSLERVEPLLSGSVLASYDLPTLARSFAEEIERWATTTVTAVEPAEESVRIDGHDD